MENKSLIKEKSFNFAIRIIKLYKYLNSKNEYIISKQVLRSGTSIGANVCEALCGISRKDFLSKMFIINLKQLFLTRQIQVQKMVI